MQENRQENYFSKLHLLNFDSDTLKPRSNIILESANFITRGRLICELGSKETNLLSSLCRKIGKKSIAQKLHLLNLDALEPRSNIILDIESANFITRGRLI